MKKKLNYILYLLIITLIISCSGDSNVKKDNIDSEAWESRQATIDSIRRIDSGNEKTGVYFIDVKYDYDVDFIINTTNTKGVSDFNCYNEIIKYATMEKKYAVNVIDYDFFDDKNDFFQCSAFAQQLTESEHCIMGRNYDWSYDSSVMIVHTKPKKGYESVGLACLQHIFNNDPTESEDKKIIALASPFCCIDGINEKGVSICTLMVSAKDLEQDNGKAKLYLPLAVRLVLDNAATTQEAVDIIKRYDIYGAFQDFFDDLDNPIDYHFFISDSTGDSRVVEFDPDDEKRTTVDTQTEYVTNFYIMDNEDPEHFNYGAGDDRYNAIEEKFNESPDNITMELGWEALDAAKQNSTTWSFIVDNETRQMKIKYLLNNDNNKIYTIDNFKDIT